MSDPPSLQYHLSAVDLWRRGSLQGWIRAALEELDLDLIEAVHWCLPHTHTHSHTVIK